MHAYSWAFFGEKSSADVCCELVCKIYRRYIVWKLSKNVSFTIFARAKRVTFISARTIIKNSLRSKYFANETFDVIFKHRV